jgi:hypothetical protein
MLFESKGDNTMLTRIFILSIFLVLFADPALIAQPKNETFITNPITVRQSIKKVGGQTSYDWYSYLDKSIGRKDDDTYYHRYRVRMPFVFGSIWKILALLLVHELGEDPRR